MAHLNEVGPARLGGRAPAGVEPRRPGRGAPREGPRPSRALLAFVAAVMGAALLVRAIGVAPEPVPIVAVDRLVAGKTLYAGRYVRLDGEVLRGPTMTRDGACLTRFTLERNHVQVVVEHHPCALPPRFGEGATVVAEGTLEGDGRFEATALFVRDTYPRAH